MHLDEKKNADLNFVKKQCRVQRSLYFCAGQSKVVFKGVLSTGRVQLDWLVSSGRNQAPLVETGLK